MYQVNLRQIVAVFSLLALVRCQKYAPRPQVSILKQINRQNADGSYSYGYENADGTYKIETKYATGDVYGKYGYIDDVGMLREIEYGASQRGFEPAGTDVTVAPPTLTQNPDAQRPLGPNEIDDGQYREDPSIYYKNDAYYYDVNNKPFQPMTVESYDVRPVTFDSSNNNIRQSPPPSVTPSPVRNYYQPSIYNKNNNQIYEQQQQQRSAQSYWRPSAQPNFQNGFPSNPSYYGNQYQGAGPAQNVDIWSGSYTVNYRR